MTNTSRKTIRVAELLTTRQDRIDGPVLLDAIRTALDEHGVVCLSFTDVEYVTPTLVNEAMVPLLDDVPFEEIKTRVLILDVTRHIGDVIRGCMENGVRWNEGNARMVPVIEAERDRSGSCRIVGDLHGMIDLASLTEDDIDALVQSEADRRSDPSATLFQQVVGRGVRDRGVTLYRRRDDARDMLDMPHMAGDLPTSGFDHRAHNAAPRSYRRR